MTPLIIGVAPNGARRTKADHPALPLSPAEIATTAAACREAGAALLHLHVRDRDGGHTLDPGTYGEAIAAVRRAVGEDLIIQVTSESVGRYTAAEQMVAVRALRPEAVSLALREIIPDEVGEADAAGFLAWLERERVLAQYILFAPEEIVGVAYDSGGVTTSTITVPLVTALGVGLASTIRGRNPMLDGFGLIAFASLSPMICVLGYGMVA